MSTRSRGGLRSARSVTTRSRFSATSPGSLPTVPTRSPLQASASSRPLRRASTRTSPGRACRPRTSRAPPRFAWSAVPARSNRRGSSSSSSVTRRSSMRPTRATVSSATQLIPSTRRTPCSAATSGTWSGPPRTSARTPARSRPQPPSRAVVATGGCVGWRQTSERSRLRVQAYPAQLKTTPEIGRGAGPKGLGP